MSSNKIEWSDIIAVYAAALSTLLAFMSWYKSRLRITAHLRSVQTDYHLRITNLSPKIIHISYYKLCWGKKSNDIDIGLYENTHIILGANRVSSIVIHPPFTFSIKEDEDLYLFLYLLGKKRPKKIKVNIDI